MKKFLSLIIAVVFALGLKAQTTLTEAPDFIAPDYFGNEIHLYEILEKGQYVLLYINVTSGDEINTITPPLVEAYNKLGCNQHDVFFVGAIPNGTTKITGEYVDEYGIEFPIIHNTDESNGMTGPAMDIWRAHNCNLPTTILIAPDKSIALDDIYPIETSDDVVSALAEFGIQEYECGEEPNPDPEPDPEPTVEQYRIKDLATNQYLHIFNHDAHESGPIGGVGVADYAESDSQIFTIEDAGNDNVYLRSADGYYIVCQQWNVDANNSNKSALKMIDNGNETFYLTDPYFVAGKANNYFKVEYVEGANYVFCDAAVTLAATWTLEAVENENPNPEPADGPAVEIGVIDITETTIEASFTPNDECASYFILCDSVGSMEQWTTVFGVTLEQLIEQWSIARTEPSTNLWKDLIPDTDYVIYVLPKDAEGKSGELQTHIVRTVAMGGEGVSVIDVKVEILTTTSVRVVATPNEETAEYHYILIEKSFSDSIGIDSTMKFLYEDPYALYEIDDWTWEELLPNTEYYAIAQGKNIKGEWGEITKVEFVTTKPDGIEELSSSFNIYPNPASTEIKITSQLNGDADVRIYDMTGRCMKEVRISNINDATINISDIDKGLYLININGSFEKLIIE